ncbi:MAG TPA: hypothetical protein VFV50_12620 [Bdellovibrionales bacterium]|nr:hypothetical protein [Bdellovibrionales bacterium]
MRDLILPFLFVLFGAGGVAAQTASPYWGYAAIERTLNARIGARGDSFQMYMYVGPGPVSLLGTYQGGAFRNGLPSPTNLMLWKIAMTGIARDIAKTCMAQEQERFNAEFLAAVSHLCRWPAASAQTDAVLEDLWLALMGYSAPEEEYLAWRGFLKSDYMQKLDAGQAVTAMATAILMNPHFLLRK